MNQPIPVKQRQSAQSMRKFSSWSGKNSRAASRAFTLLELLVVIGIIGILSAITIPSLKGLKRANLSEATYRQIMDEVGFARLRAISERTTVFFVMLPPLEQIFSRVSYNSYSDFEKRLIQDLASKQYTGYALFANRTVGDQPGFERPRYLTDWRVLPEGMMFPPFKFADVAPPANLSTLNEVLIRPFTYMDIPFPASTSRVARLPVIAFNSQGQITTAGSAADQADLGDEFIFPVEGAIEPVLQDNGWVDLTQPVEVILTPQDSQTNTFVRINWLTGRAKVQKPEIP